MNANPDAEIAAALAVLERAILDEGRVPSHHRRMMAQHRAEWPRLWAAIDGLLAVTQRGK